MQYWSECAFTCPQLPSDTTHHHHHHHHPPLCAFLCSQSGLFSLRSKRKAFSCLRWFSSSNTLFLSSLRANIPISWLLKSSLAWVFDACPNVGLLHNCIIRQDLILTQKIPTISHARSPRISVIISLFHTTTAEKRYGRYGFLPTTILTFHWGIRYITGIFV